MFSFLKRGHEARARSRLRQVFRGYSRLKAAGRLAAVQAAREELTTTPLGPGDRLAARWLGLQEADLELSVRQMVLLRLAGDGLPQAMLRASGAARGAVVFPLPRAWRDVLRKHGFRVAGARSAMLLGLHAAVHWVNGLRTLALQVREHRRGSKAAQGEPHAYFDGLVPACFPDGQGSFSEDGVVGWYARWSGRPASVTTALHAVPRLAVSSVGGIRVQFAPSPLPSLGGADLFAQLAFGVGAAAVALAQLLVGRWQPAMSLAETLRARQAALVPVERLARDYLFHNSNWIKRPLWTRVVQARGSRVIFYCYSTNIEKFSLDGRQSPLAFGWAASDWPLALAWDDGQARFLRGASARQPDVQVVGPISFIACRRLELDLPEPAIAVFDVQSMRPSIYRTLALESEYYVPQVAVPFVRDIAAAAARTGFNVLFKRKRDIGRRAHRTYTRAIEGLSDAAYWREVPPETSPLDMIRGSKAVVSTPYTSTALLGRWLGKPSIFYDPSGMCQPGDPAAHGIEVVRSPEALERWIASVLQPQAAFSS